MRDGDEPPIHGSLRPDHHREFCATHNLTGKKKVEKRCEGRGAVTTKNTTGEKSEGLWEKYTE